MIDERGERRDEESAPLPKPVIIGQAPAASAFGPTAFEAPSGKNFARIINSTFEEFLERWDRRNLLPQQPQRRETGRGRKGDHFDLAAGRLAAEAMIESLCGRLVVLCGNHVRDSFRLKLHLPCQLTSEKLRPEHGSRGLTYHRSDLSDPRCVHFVLVQHPSGVNPWYNIETNVADTQEFLLRKVSEHALSLRSRLAAKS